MDPWVEKATPRRAALGKTLISITYPSLLKSIHGIDNIIYKPGFDYPHTACALSPVNLPISKYNDTIEEI